MLATAGEPVKTHTHTELAVPMDNNVTDSQPTAEENNSGSKGHLRRILIFVILAGIAFAVYKLLGGSDVISRMAVHETRLREFDAEHPWIVLLAAFVLYVTVAGLAIPGALFLSIAYAWYFGFWKALPLVSFASTCGATICFLLSRYLFGQVVQTRFATRLKAANASFEREGSLYLFTLRLIPSPFFIVNVLMGMTQIRTWTYWWVSQIGMLPGSAVILWAGASLSETIPDLASLGDSDLSGLVTPKIWIAFLILAAFPHLAKAIMKLVRKQLKNQP